MLIKVLAAETFSSCNSMSHHATVYESNNGHSANVTVHNINSMMLTIGSITVKNGETVVLHLEPTHELVCIHCQGYTS